MPNGLCKRIPHYLLFAMIAAGGYWRTFASAAATVAVLLLLSVAIFGPETWHAYLLSARGAHVVYENGRVYLMGFTNIFGWADPERALAGGLITSGKPVVYPEIIDLWRLMRSIGVEAPKVARPALALT